MDAPRRAELDRWCARLAEGDRSAFTPLFEELWPLVRRFCRRALGNDADGDDAAQQALVNVFARATEYDRDRDAATWVLGIAAWEVRSQRRRSFRRREQALGDDRRADPALSAEQALMLRELTAAAGEVLGTLRSDDIDIILASVTEDADARTGLAPATFRKRLQRALERLRGAWRSRYDVP